MLETNSDQRAPLGGRWWLWALVTLLLFVAIWWITGVATQQQRAGEVGVRQQATEPRTP